MSGGHSKPGARGVETREGNKEQCKGLGVRKLYHRKKCSKLSKNGGRRPGFTEIGICTKIRVITKSDG